MYKVIKDGFAFFTDSVRKAQLYEEQGYEVVYVETAKPSRDDVTVVSVTGKSIKERKCQLENQ